MASKSFKKLCFSKVFGALGFKKLSFSKVFGALGFKKLSFSKVFGQLQELGQLHKISHEESKLREEMGPGQGLSPQNRWVSWVNLKVKMRAVNEKQKILQDLKRDRQTEKER